MIVAGLSMSKAGFIACLLLGLSSCAELDRNAGVAPFYRKLDQAQAQVDIRAAEEVITAYRRKHGLGPIKVDASLNASALASAQASARIDKPVSADALKAKLVAQGVRDPGINLSAGYRTLAEAFSGWRDSPPHNRVLLQKSATRFGVATVYAPGSKYKVYWALIVAEP